jgi:apolipoprotein N-acyltransferase
MRTTTSAIPTSADPGSSVAAGDAKNAKSEGAPADRAPTWALLLGGIVLVALSGNRAGVALLGWIAPVPLALAATRLRGWRRRSLLLLACVAAVSLQTLKLVGGPATPAFALAFGVPLGALAFAVLALWDLVQRRAGPASGVHAFAALTALADVAGFALSPGGHWAASAAAQTENLPLMQLASVGGLGLVGLVLAYPAGAATMLLAAPAGRRPWRHAAAAAAIALASIACGTVRLDQQDLGPTVRVAAVTVDFPNPLRSMEDLRGNVETLFARSELAARRGAQLVVWNELATLVDPDEVPGLEARAADLALRHEVDLVVAYGVVVSREPLVVDNVYRWFGADGAALDRQRKHFLPPGEPSIAGTEPLRVLERPWGRTGGAICYDYDSPALARQHARGGAGLVFVPASDWRGIDPQHTFMARVRAIEGGFSLLRATRAGTSAAFDPYGRVRATMSAWEENDRVMLATVPTRPVRTVYARVGDAPVVLLAVLVLAGAAWAGRRCTHPAAPPPPRVAGRTATTRAA